MLHQVNSLDEVALLHRLRHYLPAQSPLKDFIHHNSLHAFQSMPFFDALHQAQAIFGYKTNLSLNEYRQLYTSGKISDEVLNRLLLEKKSIEVQALWRERLLQKAYSYETSSRIGHLRSNWKVKFRIDLDALVHPILFRLVGAYLDQGIAIWNFPKVHSGLLASIKEIEENSVVKIFKAKRASELLFKPNLTIEMLLNQLIGEPKWYEQYLFDLQFAHQGWSGMISVLEQNPNGLLDKRIVSLKDFIILELLLEINALETQAKQGFEPMNSWLKESPINLFEPTKATELQQVIELWQEAYEWSFYNQVLFAIQENPNSFKEEPKEKQFQAVFCIDDREGSLRRHLEQLSPSCQTFGTPGFFSVPIYFQPQQGKFLTKLCPAPMEPNHVIIEENLGGSNEKDAHFSKKSHGILQGWLLTQTLGFWSAFKLALSIFKPSKNAANTSSFRHMNPHAELNILYKGKSYGNEELHIGFTISEMVQIVAKELRGIGLVDGFAPLVYMVSHGASSANNTHYAGYDCGACSGRPGSVNARIFASMANNLEVRELLKLEGIEIPISTYFIGALHDTTADEILFYDEQKLDKASSLLHHQNKEIFDKALSLNAKERSRRFVLTNSHDTPVEVHKKVKLRSVSLFEPRPELNHATNSLCIIGSRNLSRNVFLDRRAFLNSYDWKRDKDGEILKQIIRPIGPVCGGINLEYYFSRVDNQKLGAGTKLPHNVVGLIAVANGVEGDLRPGLPWQMVEVHDPIRLLVIVEQNCELVLKAIQQNKDTYEWFINEWVKLVSIDPVSKAISIFSRGEFISFNPLPVNLIKTNNIEHILENEEGNLPVILLEN